MSRRGTGVPPVKNDGRDGRATRFQLVRLHRELKPFKLHWFPTLGSTNTHAITMRRAGRLLAPAILLTGRQTAGRGRGVNAWHAPKGVLTVTFVLPAHDTLPPQHVPLVAGLAVRDAVAAFGVDAQIKWPNDLWHRDRKLAGLLCERFDRLDLIGVGLNVCPDRSALPEAVRQTSTSMAQVAGQPVEMTAVLIALSRAIQAALTDARLNLAAVLPRLREADALHGRQIRVSDPETIVEGIASGIDSDGRLLVRNASGTHRILSGTVRLAP